MKIPHSKPLIDDEEITAVIDVMRRGELAVGSEIEQFEKKIAKYVGKKYAIAVSNGTSALHLSLLVLNIKSGDEVILPASVCPGVMHAIEHTGATPVFCDTNPHDLNWSYQSTCSKITSKTKAIILPHLYDIPSDIKKFKSLDIPIIEDCAQSLGAIHDGYQTGYYGELSIFSFYATKMITSIDGGMILTNDAGIANKVRDLRYYAGKKNYQIRYNYKMQNINAAIGLVQLTKLKVFLNERKDIFNYLQSELSSTLGQQIITTKSSTDISSNYKFIINFTDENIKNIYIKLCEELKISTGTAIFVDLHLFKHSAADKHMVNLHNHIKNTYAFPIYPGVNKSLLEEFVKEFKKRVKQ